MVLVGVSILATGFVFVGSPSSFTVGETKTSVIADPCHPGRMVRVDKQVMVEATMIVTSADISKLPGARSIDMIANLRPGLQTTPLNAMQNYSIGGDPYRTSLGFNEIEQIQVLRGPEYATYGRDVYSGVIDVITRDTNKTFDWMSIQSRYELPKDGGWTKMQLGARYQDYWADTKVFSSTKLEGHVQPKLDLLGQSKIYMGSYLAPQPIKYTFTPDDGVFGGPVNNYLNSVGGIQFTPEYATKLGTPGIYLPRPRFGSKIGFDLGMERTTNPESYFRDAINTYGEGITTQWVIKSGIDIPMLRSMMSGAAAQGDNMNTMRFPGDPGAMGDPRCGSSISMPPGTLWYPDQPGYQAMMNTTKLSYRFDFQVSMDGGALQSEMETHCLNMALKEPAAGVRYFPYSSPDMLVSELAKMTEASMIRGPWDQARTWIYSDKASYDEVNKRIIPNIGPSQYVNGLWDVVSRGGFTKEHLSDPKYFQPKLLAASGAREDAFRWYVNRCIQLDPGEVSSWIGGSPEELTRLFNQDKTEGHFKRLFSALLASPNERLRKSTLQFLDGQTSVKLKDAVGDLRRSFYMGDEGEVFMALSVSEKFQSKRPTEALRYLAAAGKNDGIKAKAAALLAG